MDGTKNKTDINSAVSVDKMKKTRLLAFCFSLVLVSVFLFSAKVQTEPVSEVLMDRSTKHVGVQYPHSLGFYGKDIKIAVIDTGVDSGHPDLRDKIIGGYDFIENENTVQDIDGHGTEVAGIIAANGKMRGVAPEAKILAYRVSDTGNSVSSDLIVKAIQKAIEDDVDIINLSLGVNRTNDRIEDAINDAVEAGIVVVAAAGNSGPDLRTIGSPGKDPHAITVGATYNNITASLVATLDIDGKRFQVLPMVGIIPLSEPLTSEIIFGKYGKESDLAVLNVKDKILLVERGSDVNDELLYFSVKEKNAASAGAKAIIVYNNEPGIFLGDLNNKLEGPEYKPRIPAVSMSKEDGHTLLSILQNKTTGTINMFYHPDFVSFFSSRGPVSPFYIKPDLVAPGVFVNTTSIQGGYNLTSGTSFAAPHVSGAAAILLEKNPGLSPSQIKAIIISTADPVSDTFGTLFPQEISGAGRLNITRAVDANLAVSPSFAIFNLSPFTKSQTLQFKLETIDGTRAQPQIKIMPANSAAKFDHWIDGYTLFVRAEMTEQKTGQYQESIVILDKVVQRIPVLLRISDGVIQVFENDGKLDFKIDSEEKWSYAKISLYNDDGRLVDSVSLTPTKDQSITVGAPGEYWVQAELKTENGTASVYNSITVQSADRQTLDIGIPYQPLIILGGIGAIVILVGLLIRRK